jgi:hypothetical protein
MYCGVTSKFFAVTFRAVSFNTKSNVKGVHISFKSHIDSMASMSKHLNNENILDILKESDKCLISYSSNDTDDCEDNISQLLMLLLIKRVAKWKKKA